MANVANDRRPPHRLAVLVMRYWYVVLLLWLLAVVAMRLLAPSWDDVAYDGDFEYLPAEMPSVAGGLLLDQAFPEERARSEIILVIARDGRPLTESDDYVALDLQRRLSHRLAEVSLAKARLLGWRGEAPEPGSRIEDLLTRARKSLDESIDADDRFYEKFFDCLPQDEPLTLTQPRMAVAYWDRAQLVRTLGEADLAVSDQMAATELLPDISLILPAIAQRDVQPWMSLLSVLSWDDPAIGHRLKVPEARLIRLQLETELATTSNIATIEAVQGVIDDVMQYSGNCTEPGLQILPTGSAAIGGQTLIAARDAIRYTEIFTVLMILVILAGVYRAPLLVLVPLLSIGAAVMTATGLVAILADASRSPLGEWLDIRVFTTSKIFVIVILFGAGTDYCLFLISRLREEASHRPWREACGLALSRVTPALLGSALTTVLGLGMLWIARFGKFHYTGPIIALCLLVGLLVCLTLTPAVLFALGPRVFWPSKIENQPPRKAGMWGTLSLTMTRYPWTTMILGGLTLLVPAVVGVEKERDVTYDMSGQLSQQATSRQGLKLLVEHFSVGDSNPTTFLLVRQTSQSREQMQADVTALRGALYELPGVTAVRTASDPLGDYPPDKKMGLLDPNAWRRRLLREHPIAQRYFFSEAPDYVDRLARIDVVVAGDPFEAETAERVSGLRAWLQSQTERAESPWYQAKVSMAGTTASIIDLRRVTLRDNQRIKVAVVIAVLAVLIFVLRRFWLSVYLILTVLLSYYATVGITAMFFQWLYGEAYLGLDWKLPLFLFVILVAVGQDYNVYLVTRVLEEQHRGGWLSALRRAVSRTGGIITACGLVMAATFFSMTASAWVPWLAYITGWSNDPSPAMLHGIVQLGFALGLGVLIDTFFVRTFLVPSFITIVDRYQNRSRPSAVATTRDLAGEGVASQGLSVEEVQPE